MIINNKYKIENLLAKGAFGAVYKGIHIKTNEIVAIKVDIINVSSLKHEVKILNYLFTNKVKKIPSIYWYGLYEEKPCLVMTFYEYSLFDYVMRKPLSIEHINILMIQIIEIIENIHKYFVLHRDIKPQNFMIKNGDIFLIDFGLATFYSFDKHSVEQSETSMIGSPKYMSINIHNGYEYYYRDDLISIGYVYLFLLFKECFWMPKEYIDIDSKMDILDITNIHHPKNQAIRDNKIYENLIIQLKNSIYDYTQIAYYIKNVYDYSWNDIPKYNFLKHIFTYRYGG